jgi:hypothetical protein
MQYNRENEDILAEVRSVKHFFEYLTLLFTDGVTHQSRRIPREEWTPLAAQE